MTPTWSILLLVFVFWTYPATAAVIAYRLHGSSMENVKSAFNTSFNDASRALGLDSFSLKVPSIGAANLNPLNIRFQSEA